MDKLLSVKARCRHLQHVVYDDPRGMLTYSEPGLVGLAELCELGKKFEVGHPTHFDDEVARGAVAPRQRPCDGGRDPRSGPAKQG